ncbi:MAG TPA: hypothetical protein VF331_17070, partial [Polyangiales bacterium]
MARRLVSKSRPLLARPGARFRCFGDGLCCTDMHALGPITRTEAKELRARRKLSVMYNDDVEDLCVAPDDQGRCVYLTKRGCDIHARDGAAAKPTGCRRFPYGLLATPEGGRVTTQLRCPCRTLGDRPLLSLADAEVSLRDRGGRLETEGVVPDRIEITEGKRVPYARYAQVEAQLRARLERGERAELVLGAKPLAERSEGSWAVTGVELSDSRDATAGGEALAWFGDALLELAAGYKPPKRPRPWASSFERAIARTKQPQKPEAMWNDWLA